MQAIYKNFDGLDMAFHGAVSDRIAKILDAAKGDAAAAGEPQAVEIGGLTCMVRETGRRGGWRWVLDTGEDGEVWAFKAPVDGDGGAWAATVSVRSAAFVQYGDLWAIRDRLAARLEVFGWTPTRCPKSENFDSVTRVDFAVDFLVPADFEFDPGTVAAKGKKEVYRPEMREFWAARRCTGAMIGKMPNRQVSIYDKVADVTAKGKAYWWEVWGLDPDAGHKVWRVELRAGKKFLKDQWGVRCFADLDDAVADIMADTLHKVRLVDLVDSNISRCPDAPLWGAMRAAIAEGFQGLFNGLCPGRVREVVRDRWNATMAGLLRGVALTRAAVNVQTPNAKAIRAQVRAAADEVIRWIEREPDEARDAARKALNRYRLIEVEQWDKTRVRPVPGWLVRSTA